MKAKMPGKSQPKSPAEPIDKHVRDVRVYFRKMNKAIQREKTKEVLKHADRMISKLKTPSLTPKDYYTLYSHIEDKLRHLELFFRDKLASKTSPEDKDEFLDKKFEKVQQKKRLLPRLYCMVLVGSLLLEHRSSRAEQILGDLLQMVLGEQHSLRGLFLRYYLNHLIGNKLAALAGPASPGGEPPSAPVRASVNFLLTNLKEMFKLWVRVTRPFEVEGVGDVDTRTWIVDTGLLASSSILCLARLDLDAELFEKQVLPDILDLAIACGDPTAQQFALDCVIQAFPAEMHFLTFQKLFDAFTRVHADVDLNKVASLLLVRLRTLFEGRESDDEAAGGATASQDLAFLEDLVAALSTLLTSGAGHLSKRDCCNLFNEVLKFQPTSWRPSHFGRFLELTFASLHRCVSALHTGAGPLDEIEQSEVLSLLAVPIGSKAVSFLGVSEAVLLPSYSAAMRLLSAPLQQRLADSILKAFVTSSAAFTSAEQLEAFLEIVGPVFAPTDELSSFVASEVRNLHEQCARLFHLVRVADVRSALALMKTLLTRVLGTGEDDFAIACITAFLMALARLSRRAAAAGALSEVVGNIATVVESKIAEGLPSYVATLCLVTEALSDSADHAADAEEARGIVQGPLDMIFRTIIRLLRGSRRAAPSGPPDLRFLQVVRALARCAPLTDSAYVELCGELAAYADTYESHSQVLPKSMLLELYVRPGFGDHLLALLGECIDGSAADGRPLEEICLLLLTALRVMELVPAIDGASPLHAKLAESIAVVATRCGSLFSKVRRRDSFAFGIPIKSVIALFHLFSRTVSELKATHEEYAGIEVAPFKGFETKRS
eukprot:gnl/Chilomastix_cuspidata/3112.p1 GENE.gnl/Chilomastix_cuspidata/3112~~gnl/Chilomastix_cuspidata/3112.p1  ORF type:complete len:832 (+),score=314.55 gnl/Chilomastix_cuspidata/3112:43-2538(+)